MRVKTLVLRDGLMLARADNKKRTQAVNVVFTTETPVRRETIYTLEKRQRRASGTRPTSDSHGPELVDLALTRRRCRPPQRPPQRRRRRPPALLRRADLIFPLQRVVDAVATPMVLDAGTPRSICVSRSALVVLVLMWARAAMWPFFRSSALTSGFFDTCAMQCNAMEFNAMEFNAMQRNVIQLYATHPAAIAGRVRRRRLQVVRSAHTVEDLQQLQRLDAVVRAVRHLCRAPLMQCNATQCNSH